MAGTEEVSITSAPTAENTHKLIKELKTFISTDYESFQPFKILEQMGDYSYVIKFNQFLENTIMLTIQIPYNFELDKVMICASSFVKNISPKINSLQIDLETFMRTINYNESNFLIEIFTRAYLLINQNFQKPAQTKQAKSPCKQIKLLNKNQDKTLTDEVPEKKCSMKTSEDVLNRIQWDNEINKEYITVGYLDRFLGLKECHFNQFDWGDIVEADLGALAIPKHRINYFKYKNAKIWDKNERLDNVFGSTGSEKKIYDIIKKLEDQKFIPDVSQEEAVHKCGRVKKNALASRPNYFVSIPINDTSIKEKLFQLTCDLLDFNSKIDKYLFPDTSYHLTLCTLRIDSDEELKIVKNVLDKVFKNEDVLSEFPIEIDFQGIGEFYDKTLYGKSADKNASDKLDYVKDIILKELKNNSINIAGNYYEFVPHLSIVKIDAKIDSLTQMLPAVFWEQFKDFNFGKQNVDTLKLCQMGNINLNRNYVVDHKINI